MLAARPPDLNPLAARVEGFGGLMPADKGFIDACRQHLLATRHAITVITPARARRALPSHARVLLKASARWRKRLETVGSHLTERFAVARLRVHDLWHYQPRLIRKVLAHTVRVFLNRQRHRSPLDLDGLVCA